MSYIVEPQYSWLKVRISVRTWERIKAKAQWEQMTLSAIIKEWPSLLPKRLQRLVPLCFADSLEEMLERRIVGLKHDLRDAERRLAHARRLK